MALTDFELPTTTRSHGNFWADLCESFAVHRIFYAIAVLYFAGFSTVQALSTTVLVDNPLVFFLQLLAFAIPTTAIWMILIQFYFVATVDKSEKPIKDLWRRMKAVFRHPNTMLRGVPMLLAILIFMYTFTVFKANISNIIPFSWDKTFDEWDSSLHFGSRPWEWLQPVFGNLVGTLFLNVNYNAWFVILQLFCVYFGFIHAPGVDRTRFFVAYFLVWSIGGSLLATVFSSMGPCFYQLAVEGANPYAPLMQQLSHFNAIVPIWAVDTQAYLLELHQQGSELGGVTAMPSMHNATALLFVLVTWNKSKILRNLMIVHMVLIFLGSVHLGWHYAVDAYIAWALTFVLWFVASAITRWHETRPRVQAYNAKFVGNI